VPAIRGLDPEGREVVVEMARWDRSPTILLVFSYSCRYSIENWHNWVALSKWSHKKQLRLVAVNQDKQPTATEEPLFPVLNAVTMLHDVEPTFRVALNLVVTPQTIVVDPEGKVERVWSGVLRQETLQEIQRLVQALN
jgi:hypothetical protein